MADATCKTCPFWHGADGSTRAVCARNPPTATGPDRGSAWPWTVPTHWCGEHPLLQRDRLAAMAMQGLLADGAESWPEDRLSFAHAVAEDAYAIADAMLAEVHHG